MGLFGDYAFKQETRPRVTLLEMAKEKIQEIYRLTIMEDGR